MSLPPPQSVFGVRPPDLNGQPKAPAAEKKGEKVLGFLDAKLVKQISDVGSAFGEQVAKQGSAIGEQVAKLSPKKEKSVEEQTEQSLAQADATMDKAKQELKEEMVMGFIDPKLFNAATSSGSLLFSSGAEEVKNTNAPVKACTKKGVLTAVVFLVAAIAVCVALAMTEEVDSHIDVKRRLCLGKLCAGRNRRLPDHIFPSVQ